MLHIKSAKATPSQQDIQLLTPFVKEGLNIHQLEEVKAIFDSFDLTKTGLVQPKGTLQSTQTSRRPSRNRVPKQ